MRALLALFLPEDVDLSEFKFEIPYYEWDGVKYPQGAPESKYFEHFILEKSDDKTYMQFLPASYQQESMQLVLIRGDIITWMFGHYPSVDVESELVILKQIITQLTERQSKWAFIFSENFDDFKDIKLHGGVDAVVDCLQKGFRGEVRGFVTYK